MQDDAEPLLLCPPVASSRLLNILHACLSYTLLHASISSGSTEVHPLPNKSQSTAFLLYTSRHLACNLPVCRGDLWPPNDPNRRHTCNCSGWRNDSLFQYLFIHTWGNERDFLQSATLFSGRSPLKQNPWSQDTCYVNRPPVVGFFYSVLFRLHRRASGKLFEW